MKLLKKVPTKEVKRCFVTAQLIKEYGGKKRRLGALTRKEFSTALARAKRDALRMSEAQLDGFIAHEYRKRANAYNASEWYLAEVGTGEVGVWRRAGQLPLSWTNGSLEETALHALSLEQAKQLSRTRARRVITAMNEMGVADLQSEKYLLPIVFKGGTGTHGRRYLRRKMKGDIDDGCMRSIALAMSGKKTLTVYFGLPNSQ